jgi:hypothetical protein
MNGKNSGDIEARLERSLRSQVRAPKLDGRFDAAVWARIEKSAAPVAASAPRKAPRWLTTINTIGVLVAIALIVFVVAEAVSGIETSVEMPRVAPGFVERVIAALSWPVTGVALLFGLKFTGIWRRLRSEFF